MKKIVFDNLTQEILHKAFDREHFMREIIYLLEKRDYLASKILDNRKDKVFGWLREDLFFDGLHKYIRNGG